MQIYSGGKFTLQYRYTTYFVWNEEVVSLNKSNIQHVDLNVNRNSGHVVIYFLKKAKMFVVARKIKSILDKKGLTQYRFAQLIDYDRGAIANRLRGERPFPSHVIEKMAPVLEVSVDEIKGWIVADRYSKEVIQLAIQAKKEKQDKGLVLTTKIDEVLKPKNLSRTALSKLIKHSQSSLNCAITGKEPLSKKLMQKISLALDIPEIEIQSWIVADKYSFESLEVALREL